MRIGLLTDVYRPGFSGVANHVLLLKQELERLGQEVVVFAFETGRSPTGGTDVIYSPGIILAADYPFHVRLSRFAAEQLCTMDLLHIHQPFASGSAALRAIGKRSTPIVFTSHTRYDLYARAYLPMVPSVWSAALIRRYMLSFSKRLSAIIAPSPSMANILREWRVQAPVQVIPNGIDLRSFITQTESPAALRRQLGLPETRFLYLFVGRIADEKNIMFLIDSFRHVVRQFPEAALVLAGGGPKMEQVRSLIDGSGLADAVYLTGRLPYERIAAVMHASDVFVTASKTEVHPLTVIEAGASGLPVVGLHAPGVAETVIDGKTGFLCAETPQAFAACMLALAGDAQLRRQMSQRARREAAAYSAERTAAQTWQVYQNVCETKAGR